MNLIQEKFQLLNPKFVKESITKFRTLIVGEFEKRIHFKSSNFQFPRDLLSIVIDYVGTHEYVWTINGLPCYPVSSNIISRVFVPTSSNKGKFKYRYFHLVNNPEIVPVLRFPLFPNFRIPLCRELDYRISKCLQHKTCDGACIQNQNGGFPLNCKHTLTQKDETQDQDQVQCQCYDKLTITSQLSKKGYTNTCTIGFNSFPILRKHKLTIKKDNVERIDNHGGAMTGAPHFYIAADSSHFIYHKSSTLVKEEWIHKNLVLTYDSKDLDEFHHF